MQLFLHKKCRFSAPAFSGGRFQRTNKGSFFTLRGEPLKSRCKMQKKLQTQRA
jgi:hypothetical protein